MALTRLGLLQQSLTGIGGVSRSNMLDRAAILPMVLPTISGAAVGGLATTWLHPEILKPVLLGSMIAISVIMLMLPEVPAPQDDARVRRLRERPLWFVMLFGAGVYGGFVQAGVGFVLIAALAGGGLRYDLVRANALKVVCTALLSVASLAVFVSTDRVE